MSFQAWLQGEVEAVEGWFTDEEAAVVKFFGPLFGQVLTAAKTVGVDAFLAAATAAATTASSAIGDKVAAAEAAFLATGAAEGLTAIHNAEAGAIKAAVAVIQTNVAPVAPAPADAAQ